MLVQLIGPITDVLVDMVEEDAIEVVGESLAVVVQDDEDVREIHAARVRVYTHVEARRESGMAFRAVHDLFTRHRLTF